MKAAVYYGKKNIQVTQVPEPEIGDDEVKVKVEYCGVCGTDIHIFNGDGGSTDVTPPLIPGHEYSGTVVEIGNRVTNIKVGDRVSLDPNDMCGECYFCKSGKQHFCPNNGAYGVVRDGGFAQYTVGRQKQVYKLPDHISFLHGAMIEPLSCCLHGIDLCHISMGDTVLVIGGGPIGMIMLQLAKKAGATQIILSEPVESKRDLALRLGATKVVDPIHDDIEESLKKEFHNIDVVIECAGNVNTQKQAVQLGGMGATIMFFGLTSPTDELTIHPDDIFKKELHITSSYINPYTYERGIQVLEEGDIKLDEIITSIVPLDDIEKVFTDPQYRRGGKVMIKCV